MHYRRRHFPSPLISLGRIIGYRLSGMNVVGRSRAFFRNMLTTISQSDVKKQQQPLPLVDKQPDKPTRVQTTIINVFSSAPRQGLGNRNINAALKKGLKRKGSGGPIQGGQEQQANMPPKRVTRSSSQKRQKQDIETKVAAFEADLGSKENPIIIKTERLDEDSTSQPSTSKGAKIKVRAVGTKEPEQKTTKEKNPRPSGSGYTGFCRMPKEKSRQKKTKLEKKIKFLDSPPPQVEPSKQGKTRRESEKDLKKSVKSKETHNINSRIKSKRNPLLKSFIDKKEQSQSSTSAVASQSSKKPADLKDHRAHYKLKPDKFATSNKSTDRTVCSYPVQFEIPTTSYIKKKPKSPPSWVSVAKAERFSNTNNAIRPFPNDSQLTSPPSSCLLEISQFRDSWQFPSLDEAIRRQKGKKRNFPDFTKEPAPSSISSKSISARKAGPSSPKIGRMSRGTNTPQNTCDKDKRKTRRKQQQRQTNNLYLTKNTDGRYASRTRTRTQEPEEEQWSSHFDNWFIDNMPHIVTQPVSQVVPLCETDRVSKQKPDICNRLKAISVESSAPRQYSLAEKKRLNHFGIPKMTNTSSGHAETLSHTNQESQGVPQKKISSRFRALLRNDSRKVDLKSATELMNQERLASFRQTDNTSFERQNSQRYQRQQQWYRSRDAMGASNTYPNVDIQQPGPSVNSAVLIPNETEYYEDEITAPSSYGKSVVILSEPDESYPEKLCEPVISQRNELYLDEDCEHVTSQPDDLFSKNEFEPVSLRANELYPDIDVVRSVTSPSDEVYQDPDKERGPVTSQPDEQTVDAKECGSM